jgi:MATE family multidrug resistance protein
MISASDRSVPSSFSYFLQRYIGVRVRSGEAVFGIMHAEPFWADYIGIEANMTRGQLADRIAGRWRGAGGCREVLTIAIPMVLSTSAHTLQMFIDGVFLSRYHPDSLSASMQGGITAFVVSSFLFGIVGYGNTFVAQYIGAKQNDRVGAVIWQAIYFTLVAGAFAMLLALAGPALFTWIGHEKSIAEQECVYFQIMSLGTIAPLLGAAVASFYTGRGCTWPVMWVHTFSAGLNVLFDYALIFGHWGLPEMGLRGAAIATIAAEAIGSAILLTMFLLPRYRREFGTLSGIRPDFKLLGRLLYFGVPNGVSFMMDIIAFTAFIGLVGQWGRMELAASTMSFRINMLAFMPMIGFGMAVTTLVGQNLGANKPELAARATWSAFYMTVGYMTAVSICYVLVPQWFLAPFVEPGKVEEYAPILKIATTLLMFIAAYSLFDTGNIIFASALKGAGDTRFVMIVPAVLSWLMMVIPTYIAVKMKWSLYVGWACATVFVCVLAIVFLMRFLGGKWKQMRVIEMRPAAMPAVMAEVPTAEAAEL